jgi:2,4-dienoyl-CoA reductase-like NADH-dependent reductase (Old Yellow Enzyme family)
MGPLLFSPIKIRDLTIRNRIFVSPMCQYSAVDGVANDWHLVHLGGRAVGGAGLVMCEATAVSPEGRISPEDLGIWNQDQASSLTRITQFIKGQGATPAIQLAHAGRKAGTAAPWNGGAPVPISNGGWVPLAPSAISFANGYQTPEAMTLTDIEKVLEQFKRSAHLALTAGFDIVEVHMAHGYLLHEFLSPLSNRRMDNYGRDLAGRMRLPLEVARAIRSVWPDHLPVFVRISTTDWVDGGWDLDQSVVLCHELKKLGVDLIDASSGGLVPDAKIPAGPGFQVPFAERIRKDVGVLTGAVGFITTGEQAESILKSGNADVIFLARQFLRDPYFPLHAAQELGATISWPKQYERAR